MKFISRFLPFVLLATLISACAGGGGGVTPRTQPASASRGIATGTLVIGLPATKPQARSRRPDYVSADTTYATLWIDSATSGTRVACTGTAKTCSINWTSTAGSHLFIIAIDDSTSIKGGGNVLADGDAQETLSVGSNTLSDITLNGVPAAYNYLSGAVYAAGNSNCTLDAQINCAAGTFEATDADGQTIDGPGDLDGCPSASPSANGTIFCGAVPANGQIPFSVYCVTVSGTSGAATNGNLSVALPSPNGASPYVSAAQLATYSLLYQSNISATTAFPSYTCTNGTISTGGVANGTVTAN